MDEIIRGFQVYKAGDNILLGMCDDPNLRNKHLKHNSRVQFETINIVYVETINIVYVETPTYGIGFKNLTLDSLHLKLAVHL